jgi:hypothetical protein
MLTRRRLLAPAVASVAGGAAVAIPRDTDREVKDARAEGYNRGHDVASSYAEAKAALRAEESISGHALRLSNRTLFSAADVDGALRFNRETRYLEVFARGRWCEVAQA